MLFGSANWIGRLEYLHYNFGPTEGATSSVSTVPGSIPENDRAGRQTIEVVRAGVSYKFAS